MLTKRLHHLSFVTTPENDKYFDYISTYYKYKKLENTEQKSTLLKQEK